MDLTPDVIFSLLQSSDPFPVDFEDAMTWWDCRTKTGNPVPKGDLKEKLENEFCEHLDFVKFFASEISKAKKRGGHNREVIKLTVDCFKSMGMTVPGERGKQIRRYFLECEAELKKRIEEDRQNSKDRVIKLLVCDAHATWKPRFEEQFFEEAYRVTGYKRSVKGHPSCMGGFIKNNIYMYFPEGTLDKLEQVNPSEKGRRKRKHHQHLKTLGLSILDSQKSAALAVMPFSTKQP